MKQNFSHQFFLKPTVQRPSRPVPSIRRNRRVLISKALYGPDQFASVFPIPHNRVCCTLIYTGGHNKRKALQIIKKSVCLFQRHTVLKQMHPHPASGLILNLKSHWNPHTLLRQLPALHLYPLRPGKYHPHFPAEWWLSS